MDGNISVSTPVGDMKLSSAFGIYSGSGNLTSSTFDTGTSSNFNQITWAPNSEPVQTGSPNVRFQVATNNDGSTWNFVGPDGTSATYYTTSNTNIASINNGDRYFRYKTFLNTANTAYTPTISDVALTFTSSCIPPGQVAFTNLSPGPYTITINAAGYSTYTGSVTVSASWQSTQVILAP